MATFIGYEPRAIDIWYAAKSAEKLAWGAAASTTGAGVMRFALTGNAATLRLGAQAFSFLGRAHLNAARGVLGTRLVAGGSATIGSTIALTTSAAALGYTIGAVVGTGISQAIWGEEGAKKALELYMSPSKFYDDAIVGAGDNVSAIWNHYF